MVASMYSLLKLPVFLHCASRLIFFFLLRPFTCINLLLCRVRCVQEEPLALRQLLWLDDELFVAVSSGPLPGSSTLLMLHPAPDADDTLATK